MEIVSGREAVICRGNEVEGPICEQRLWVAVLTQALEDWQGDRIRAKHEAEQFLLHDKKDFDVVCAAAGIDGTSFRSKLRRLAAASAPQQIPMAA